MNSAEPYQKFVGREISCTVKTEHVKLSFTERDFTIVEYNEDDPTILEIKAMASAGMLRIFTPGRDIGTYDLRNDRINVSIKKVDDVYKVTSISAG